MWLSLSLSFSLFLSLSFFLSFFSLSFSCRKSVIHATSMALVDVWMLLLYVRVTIYEWLLEMCVCAHCASWEITWPQGQVTESPKWHTTDDLRKMALTLGEERRTHLVPMWSHCGYNCTATAETHLTQSLAGTFFVVPLSLPLPKVFIRLGKATYSSFVNGSVILGKQQESKVTCAPGGMTHLSHREWPPKVRPWAKWTFILSCSWEKASRDEETGEGKS